MKGTRKQSTQRRGFRLVFARFRKNFVDNFIRKVATLFASIAVLADVFDLL